MDELWYTTFCVDVYFLIRSIFPIALICRLRDVVAGRVATIVRTFSPFAEYFGRYNGTNYDTPQLARSMMHGRDVMAKSQYGQDTWGSVRLGCRGEGY